MARRFRINRSDFDDIGFTPLCPGCRAFISGLPSQGHSELCRSRVEDHLLKKGNPRIRHLLVRLEHEEELKKEATQKEDRKKDIGRKSHGESPTTSNDCSPKEASTNSTQQGSAKPENESITTKRDMKLSAPPNVYNGVYNHLNATK